MGQDYQSIRLLDITIRLRFQGEMAEQQARNPW
jgi:hypothetical protein